MFREYLDIEKGRSAVRPATCEVGLLSTKVVTPKRKEVAIPNVVLAGVTIRRVSVSHPPSGQRAGRARLGRSAERGDGVAGATAAETHRDRLGQ
jgi:hypothetical protein